MVYVAQIKSTNLLNRKKRNLSSSASKHPHYPISYQGGGNYRGIYGVGLKRGFYGVYRPFIE
jgi:hypothetical protein